MYLCAYFKITFEAPQKFFLVILHGFVWIFLRNEVLPYVLQNVGEVALAECTLIEDTNSPIDFPFNTDDDGKNARGQEKQREFQIF